MSNVIEIENVSKIFSKNYKSARTQIKQIFLDIFLGCKNHTRTRKGEFFALTDVSFSIKKNEKIAILGPNGSGKSTLLKMLSGIYLPDNGEICVEGVVNSILELSTGFKPILSGRENIYLKFAMMGKNKEEVDEIIESIITFSELEDHIDTPFKYYSSGMKSKLGFSIVTSMKPEIIILDEVFAAGDKKFRIKSAAKMKELYETTTTILVTHSMGIVKEMADRVIVLEKGKKVYDGEVLEGIQYYENMMK